jgi:predicted transcriptional regulator YdeE
MNLIKSEAEFNVVGIILRTTNKAAIQEATIQQLWQKFFIDQVISKVDNKIDKNIIVLYYDFETDKDGEYTVLIGVKVASLENIPSELIGKYVAPEKRMIFTSPLGPIQNIVFDTWKIIWAQEDQKELHRTYGIDYELYDARSHNPVAAQIEVHIGIR